VNHVAGQVAQRVALGQDLVTLERDLRRPASGPGPLGDLDRAPQRGGHPGAKARRHELLRPQRQLGRGGGVGALQQAAIQRPPVQA
jgi:hypothetical protein